MHTKCNRFKGLRLGRFFRISELPFDHHGFICLIKITVKQVKYYYIKKCVLCIFIMYVSKYTHAWCMICIMRVCIYPNPVYIYIYIYTVMAKISTPLVNMIKEGCENESSLLILLIFYLKKLQKSNLSLDDNNLKWGEISLITFFFSNTRWTQLLAPLDILVSKISLKYIPIHIHNFEHSRVIMTWIIQPWLPGSQKYK